MNQCMQCPRWTSAPGEPVTFTLDGESVNVLVFLQPYSKQPCLFGTNPIPSLGITVLHCSGEPVLANAAPEPTPESQVTQVSLVESVVIPGQITYYLRFMLNEMPISKWLLILFQRPMSAYTGILGTQTRWWHNYSPSPPLSGRNCTYMKAEALLVEAFDAEHNVLALHEAMHWPPLPNGASVAASSCNALVQAISNCLDRIERIMGALSSMTTLEVHLWWLTPTSL